MSARRTLRAQQVSTEKRGGIIQLLLLSQPMQEQWHACSQTPLTLQSNRVSHFLLNAGNMPHPVLTQTPAARHRTALTVRTSQAQAWR